MNNDTPDELDKLRAKDAEEAKNEFYDTLEDNIMQLRSDIKAQAILMTEMNMDIFRPFLERVLTLEKLQQKYDEWSVFEEDEHAREDV